MADDRPPFADSDYPFDQEFSSEDEVLQELKRIIGESEALLEVGGLESTTQPQSESEFEEEPVAVIRIASSTLAPPPDLEATIDHSLVHDSLVDHSPVERSPEEHSPADLVSTADLEAAPQAPASQYALDEIIKSIDEALEEATPVLTERSLRDAVSDARSQQERYLVFSLAGIKYAVPAAEVVEIGRVPSVTMVPNVPAWLLGVTNRRGDILSVVDLRSLLGLKSTDQSDSARIVVVRSTGDELMTGMIVDQVNGMLNVVPGAVQPPAGPIDTGVTPYLVGLCEHKSDLVTVLDLELLLASQQMRQFELV
ncbi:MAG TPA: chemotaxis protein CheW [Blastocatellia bacterium]|nr:chemotaxis protein CheW [Blastocatellia bacterium]